MVKESRSIGHFQLIVVLNILTVKRSVEAEHMAIEEQEHYMLHRAHC